MKKREEEYHRFNRGKYLIRIQRLRLDERLSKTILETRIHFLFCVITIDLHRGDGNFIDCSVMDARLMNIVM